MLQLTVEQRKVRDRVAAVVETRLAPIGEAIEGGASFPWAAYQALAAEKLFALALPGEYGGPGADAVSLFLMVETIARVSPSAALLVFPSNAVLRTMALTGTEEQKKRLFAELAQGDKPMGFCLTEPEYGSDAGGIQTRARRQGDEYVVSGGKSFTTLGEHGRYYLTFVRTGGPGPAGISALVIPRDAPGLSFGPPEKKMGLHGSMTAQMYLDQCRVPAENLLGGLNQGWRILREVANPMRVWGAASLSLGMAQGLMDAALEHAMAGPGGGSIEDQDTAFALAEMKMLTEAVRSMIHRVCLLLDDGRGFSREVETLVSAAKAYAADTGVAVAELAARVIGPAMMAADHPAARLFCSAKGVQIFDGSNQVQRLVIGRNLARDWQRARVAVVNQSAAASSGGSRRR